MTGVLRLRNFTRYAYYETIITMVPAHRHQVRWTRVPDLIERRKVFLKGGWAYVPGREQASIVYKEFEVTLERALEV